MAFWATVLLGVGDYGGCILCYDSGPLVFKCHCPSIRLLKNATLVLWGLLCIHLTWDIYYLSTDTYVDTYGITRNIWAFTARFDGFLLGVAFFMGNLVPMILNIFIWRTLKLQATQSATGLLYVSVVSILFGDLLFKYYLLQFGFLV